MQLASRTLRLGSSTARYGKFSHLGQPHNLKSIAKVNLQQEEVSNINAT